MAPLPGNTIQAYFRPESSSISSDQTLPAHVPSSATLPPSDQTRLPSTTFTFLSIGALAGGLKHVTVTGRVLALREQTLNRLISSDIRLILQIIIGDETGVLTVILNYKDKPDPFRLGLLVTICARQLWSVPTIQHQPSTLYTSVFPDQSGESLIRILDDDDKANKARCRIPHAYRRGKPLTGLTTLEDFLHRPPTQQSKVMVVVWRLALKDTLTTPRGQSHRIELEVLDMTSRAKLLLGDVNALSIPNWRAGQTVLLLSVPRVIFGSEGPYLGMGTETLMHVNPDIEEVKALKGFASEQMGKLCVPAVFNVKEPLGDDQRVLFTLADLDNSFVTPPSLRIPVKLSVMTDSMSHQCQGRRQFADNGTYVSHDCRNGLVWSLSAFKSVFRALPILQL